jgi:hypothetical protein
MVIALEHNQNNQTNKTDSKDVFNNGICECMRECLKGILYILWFWKGILSWRHCFVTSSSQKQKPPPPYRAMQHLPLKFAKSLPNNYSYLFPLAAVQAMRSRCIDFLAMIISNRLASSGRCLRPLRRPNSPCAF